MSEECKKAYRALRTKDFLMAIQPDMRNIAIVFVAVAIGTAIKRDLASFIVVGLVAFLMICAVVAIRFLVKECVRKMEKLGYSEVELEADAISAEQ